ncbi:hypothetical protein MRX96_036815 [Rhipicephalus microplus]
MAKDVGAYLKKQQEQGPPELSQQWAEFEELYNKRLWHQLTLKLLTFVCSPKIQIGLFQMYENFISEFENKMKPLSLVKIAAQVSQSIPDMEQRLAFITKTKEKKVLEETESQAEALPGVTEVHGRFYQLCSDYHQQMGDHQAYYRDALRFLGCTPLERIPLEEQQQRAFALCLAALLGEGVYNFGELLAHPILECLQCTDRQWVVQLLSAFNCGSLAQYETLRPSWSRQVEVLVMKALSLGLVRGTIDQVDAQVHMQWVQPRVLSRDQIAGMKKRLDAWNADVASMEKLLETKAHEIISI